MIAIVRTTPNHALVMKCKAYFILSMKQFYELQYTFHMILNVKRETISKNPTSQIP